MEVETKEIQMCRVCLRTGSDGYRSLFGNLKSVSINEHINSLANLSITKGDGFPDAICSTCLIQLETCITFKINCIESNNILLNNIKPTVDKINVAIKREEINDFEIAYLDDEEIWTDLVHSHSPKTDLKTEYSTKESPQCDDCGEIFPSKCKLRVHWKKVHKPKTFLCPICKRLFKSLKAYNRHIKITPSSCSELFKIGINVEGEGVGRLFACSQCDYKSRRVIHAKAHMITHTKEKLHRCEICGKAYTQSGSLKTHLEGEHFKSSSLKGCHICGKLFRGNSRLYKHIKTHNLTTYECEICKKLFKGQKSLKVHMARHSGIKAYTCEQCAASFYSSAELCNHRKVHAGVRFTSRQYHKCDLCDYKTTKYRLKKHMQKHTVGNKPYFCNTCGIFFHTFQKLTAHERIHFEDNKTFSCPFCDKMFYCRRSVSKHVISKHGSKMLQKRENLILIKEEIKTLETNLE